MFPLAGLLSMISNSIQIKSQTSNLIYIKREKAEISNGIGNFEQCINILSQMSFMVSAGIMYFTASTYKNIFTGKLASEVQPIAHWSLVDYLILVITVEHAMLLVKILIEYIIPETPLFVKEGEQDKAIIAQDLLKKIKQNNQQPTNRLMELASSLKSRS